MDKGEMSLMFRSSRKKIFFSYFMHCKLFKNFRDVWKFIWQKKKIMTRTCTNTVEVLDIIFP